MKLFLIFVATSSLASAALVERRIPASVTHDLSTDSCDYTLSVQLEKFPILRDVFISFGGGDKNFTGGHDEVGFRPLALDKIAAHTTILGLTPPYTLKFGRVAHELLRSDEPNVCKARMFKIFFEE